MSSTSLSTSSIIIKSSSSDKISSSPPSSSPKAPIASQQPSGPSKPNLQNRSLSEIIGETFPPFDHQSCIVKPFNDEANRDLAFTQELSAMLLDALIETHAWASTRPKHESSNAAQNIEQKLVSVMEAEKEQGMCLSRPPSSLCLYSSIVDKTRQQLNQFVTQIKTALAALTGLGV